jgi:hypothetical protein
VKRLAVIALAAGTAAALTGCEKPNPGVTVFSGTNSEHAQALCWSPDAAESVQARGCAGDILQKAVDGGEVPIITVTPGDVVGISVDPVVADNGWVPVVGNESLSQTPITTTYFRFTFPEAVTAPEGGFEMQIKAAGENASDLRGIWLFKLTPRA